jgi:hypothetical protein
LGTAAANQHLSSEEVAPFWGRVLQFDSELSLHFMRPFKYKFTCFQGLKTGHTVTVIMSIVLKILLDVDKGRNLRIERIRKKKLTP